MSTLQHVDWFSIVVSLTALLLLPLVAFACLVGCGRPRGHQPTIPANPNPPPPAPRFDTPRDPDAPNPQLLVTLEPGRPQANPRLIVTEQRGIVPWPKWLP